MPRMAKENPGVGTEVCGERQDIAAQTLVPRVDGVDLFPGAIEDLRDRKYCDILGSALRALPRSWPFQRRVLS